MEYQESKLHTPLEELSDKDQSSIEIAKRLRTVPYKEITQLAKFINEKTPFSTKHGVKGAEFNNVVVVIGRGWNSYDFNQMLEWFVSPPSPKDEEAFYRNRNLFYVACSRPKKRLALFFTQELSRSALSALASFYGSENIHSLI